MHKVLVLGGSGLVGNVIISEMSKSKSFQMYGTYFENPMTINQGRNFKLCIEDLASLTSLLNTIKPQSVISCLRGDYDQQMLLHTTVAQYLKENGGSLYFCSTTNVYDQDTSKPHYEDDLPNSCSDYGQYKIDCEKRMIELLQEKACILRLPQVWGKDSPRMKDLLNSNVNKEKITVYPKLMMSTYLDVMIAKKIAYIIEHQLKGVFHLVVEDVIIHKDFYKELIKGLGYENVKIEENFEEEGYFALLSKRNNEFPEELRLTNKAVIDYLIHK